MGRGKNRISFIDIFKGIAILLVIIQHSIGGHVEIISKFILSFHMALFFFAAGFVNLNSKLTKKKLLSRIRSFVFPQICVGILNVVWYWLILVVVLKHTYNQRWIEYFWTWFLPTISYVYIVYYFIKKMCDDRKIFVFMLICVAIAAVFKYTNPHSLFYVVTEKTHLSKIPIATLFFLIGLAMARYVPKSSKYSLLIAGAAFVCVCITSHYNGEVLWYKFEMSNLWLAISSGFFGCVFILYLSKWIGSNFWLEYLGRNSLTIYVIQFIVYRCVGLIFKDTVFSVLLGTFFSCVICLIGAIIIERIKNFIITPDNKL